MKTAFYCIRHMPTRNYPVEDEGGSYLVGEDDGFMIYGYEKTVKAQFDLFPDQFYDEIMDITYPKSEFEIIEFYAEI